MSCGNGLPTIDDCAELHWAVSFDGVRQGDGSWRAPCPGCQAPRALKWWLRRTTIGWCSFCSQHDKEMFRPLLAASLGPCLGGHRKGPEAVDHAELAALARAAIQPRTLRVRLLELSGMSLDSAMDELKVDRSDRYKIRQQLWSFDHKPAGR